MRALDALRPRSTSTGRAGGEARSLDLWADLFFGDTLSPLTALATTYGKMPSEPIGDSFAAYVSGALRSDGVVSAVELVRLAVFSEARFQYQRFVNGRPARLFGDPSLSILEQPWPNGTTGDLLARMLLDADFAGSSFKARVDGEIIRLRPDWTDVILEPRILPLGPDRQEVQVGWRKVGFAHYQDGYKHGTPAIFLPHEVSHFAPYPDPLASWRGMSWLTPVLREVQADIGASRHKLKFFENAATPNLAVSLPKEINKNAFGEFVEKMEELHKGARNAYKTLYLGGGADVTVIGANMQQLDFKTTQGAGETRIAAAGRIHPVLVGLSEGLAGSSLNAGNYNAAKRSTVDGAIRPLWRNAAGSLQAIVPPPPGARLWYDGRDIPFLRDDEKDLAEIQASRAQTIRTLVDAGYEPTSVIDAVESEDFSLLQHSGWFSVQLQQPGAGNGTGDTTDDDSNNAPGEG